MVEWKLNKVRDRQFKLLVIGMPMGYVYAMLLCYFLLLPEVGAYIYLIVIIITSILYGPGTFLVWKYHFSLNPKFIGTSKNGIHFSKNYDEFEDHIYWTDIEKIEKERKPQQVEIQTIFLKDGIKRKLKGIDRSNVERIIREFNNYT